MSRIASFGVRLYGAAARMLPLEREPLRTLYSRAYFAYKRLEDPFAALLRTYPNLLRGGNVVDAGANIGYTALLFARHIDPEFRVHAFEPDALAFAMLARNTRGARVFAHEQALGATSGAARLWHNDAHPADHRIVPEDGPNVRVVNMTTIDDVLGDAPVSFVKIDVQGYELEVSRGMTRVLAANPQIAVALEYGIAGRDLLAFYRERGFSFALIERGRLAAADEAAIDARAAKEEYVNVLCRR